MNFSTFSRKQKLEQKCKYFSARVVDSFSGTAHFSAKQLSTQKRGGGGTNHTHTHTHFTSQLSLLFSLFAHNVEDEASRSRGAILLCLG